MNETELVGLELDGWRSLSSSGQDARAFYDRVLDKKVLMVLPGGLILDDRGAVLDSMSGQPWASFELEKPTVMMPTADVAVVAYGVEARRPHMPGYSALVSSTYVHRADGWKLALHQQTPR